jgi:hypothetical protein
MAVTGNSTCATAFAIPPGPGRGYFTGDTSTLTGHYSSPCAGSTPPPAAVYQLTVTAMQRVTIVVQTSFFNVVWITQTDSCPGTAPMTPEGRTCNLGTRTTLTNTLAPGTYYIFITGLSSGGSGAYGLLVQPSM